MNSQDPGTHPRGPRLVPGQLRVRPGVAPTPVLLLCLCLWTGLLTPHSTRAARNILLVIADDFGADNLALYNSHPDASFAPTPNLNALAARGVRFAHAYAYPICSPTRSSILTGRYGFRTGVTAVLAGLGSQGIYTNELTLPELLAPTHRCGSFGKWHLGGTAPSPNAVGGWPQFSGSLAGAIGQSAASYYTWSKVSNGVTRANFSGYATTANVDDALTWLAAQGTNRWFLWLAFNAPHTPFHLPPTNLCSHYAGLSGTSTDIQQNPRSYFEAAVQAMDTELGRLLAAIDTNETTVLFVGDNGTVGRIIQPPYSAARAKDTLYEGGTRVPFIAAGPDIVQPGRTDSNVVHVVDLYATLLELSGVDPAGALPRGWPLDSRSLRPILRQEPFAPAEDAVLVENSEPFTAGTQPGRATRRGDYKLIQFANQTEEFYHLASDPLESTNLINRTLTSPQRASLELLRARLAAWSNVPTLHGQSVASDRPAVDVSWFAGHRLSLLRNPDSASTNWTRQTNAILQDLGTTLRLTDPQPSVGPAFYRVRQD